MTNTIILDIDGCILYHYGSLTDQILKQPILLPNVLEKFKEWDMTGCKIILLTGRRESHRSITEKQLNDLGIFWDQLVMGAGRGPRILINDLKLSSSNPTALAINLKRNEGLTF
jgi:hypothetical protein